MAKKRLKNKQNLFEIADAQEGLFTATQAEEAGYIRTNHSYYVKTGQWQREIRGVYRMALYPDSRFHQKICYALWSMNREGKMEGVYSFDTALSYYELTDLNPAKLHMTVPKAFRRSEIPQILKLYKEDLSPEDIKQERGFQVTTVRRTILDVLNSDISPEFVEQAAVEAVERGLLMLSELRKLFEISKVDPDTKKAIEHLLKKRKAA